MQILHFEYVDESMLLTTKLLITALKYVMTFQVKPLIMLLI